MFAETLFGGGESLEMLSGVHIVTWEEDRDEIFFVNPGSCESRIRFQCDCVGSFLDEISESCNEQLS